MVAESNHSPVAKHLVVQLDGVDQVGFYVISFLRLSPDVVSVINTPENDLSQILGIRRLAKSKIKIHQKLSELHLRSDL